MGEPREIGGEQANIQGEDTSSVLLRPRDMSISRDEEDNRHLLTEDQFERLCAMGGDLSLEVSLGLFGAGIGLAQNVIATLAALWDKTPPTGVDIVLSMLCFACFAGAAAKFSQHRQTQGDLDKLRTQLRNRPRIKVKS